MFGTRERSDFLEMTALEKENHEISVQLFMAKHRFKEFLLIFK